MSDEAASTDTLINETTSLCGRCQRSLPAQIWRRDEQVWMTKNCTLHGEQEVLLSSNADWYEGVLEFKPELRAPRKVMREVEKGCPLDCGACSQHEQGVLLPIVPITSACNLSCPICYTHNINDGAYHMSEETLVGILDQLRALTPDRRIINITGGEPTQHPDFMRLIERCHEEGIHRITISTHGLRFIKEPQILERLAAIDARVILSFDSFEDPINKAMLGGKFTKGKLQVVELLEQHEVNTTLLPVLARGYNDHEIGQMLDLALSRDFVRSVEFHTMTFTGQYGDSFDRSGRYTAYDALEDISAQSNGALRIEDFIPSPAAHPLCYQVCYLLRLEDDSWYPMIRFMEPEDMLELLGGGLYMEPDARVERRLHDVINRLWAGDIDCEKEDEVLDALRALLRDIFAPDHDHEERMRRAERWTKAIYLHAHMDAETFDSERIRQCCVGIVGEDGSNIPSCAYNVIYRARDPRFSKLPLAPLEKLGPGYKPGPFEEVKLAEPTAEEPLEVPGE